MRIAFITATVFTFFFSVTKAQTELSLSLEDAVTYATQHQPQFQNFVLDKDIASAKRMEAATKYAPKVNGTFDLRDNLKLGEVALKFPNPVTGEQQDLRVKQGTTYTGTGGVDLNQPIVDMSAVADMKIADAQKRLAQVQYDNALVELKMNVSRMYYLAQLNKERVSRNEKNVQRCENALADAKVRFDNKQAIKSEVSRAELNLSNARFQLKVSQDSVVTTLMSFANLIGAPNNATLSLTTALPQQAEPVAIALPNMDEVFSSHVEVRAESEQKRIATMQLNKINYQYIPTLSGYAYVGGQGLDNDALFRKDKWFWTSYIGVKLNVPIFDGLQKYTLARQQKLTIRKSDNNLQAIQNNLRFRVQSTAITYKNTYDNLTLAKLNVALAEEIVKEANTRYTNGFATLQEVLDAENTLRDTELNYLQALYAYVLAQLDWKKANGKL